MDFMLVRVLRGTQKRRANLAHRYMLCINQLWFGRH